MHTKPVNQPTSDKEREGRRELGNSGQIAKIAVGPAKIRHHVRLQDGDDRPIHRVEYTGHAERCE